MKISQNEPVIDLFRANLESIYAYLRRYKKKARKEYAELLKEGWKKTIIFRSYF